MDYYMLKMTWTDDNGEASLDHEELRKFISQTHLIGLGSPQKGAYVFDHQIRKEDIVIVLGKRWAPQVIVKVLDDYAKEYHPDTSLYPLLGWIKHVRNVEVLAWCHAPDPQLNLPSFNTNWSRNTCCHINDTKQQETIKKWIETIMSNKTVKDYAEMLRKVKNLIFTGAPGTGKTHLAREIAREITKDKEDTPKDKRHWEFVQFHPSYDYTDFVEGLRPTPPDEKNNIGFQGEDGIFKAFCKRAINNQTSNFEEAYKQLCSDLEENYSQENPLELKTKAQNKSFKVFLNSNGSLSLITGGSNEVQGSLTPGKMQTFLTPSPYKYWKSYFSAVLEYMELKHGLKMEPVNPDQKYVFIIDEINRGDIAKIFGELFFAIDPDYRGKKGTIKTQYANLFQDDEVFENGMFYVPENVYIIGTMNDIDRNVECMDFAIRRRFTWVEIEPTDTIAMWNDPEKGISEYKVDAEKYMKAINEAITETPGLGSAYQLGAAYFLKLKNYKGTSKEKFRLLWKNHIEPLLKEYLRGMPEAEATRKKLEDKWNNALKANPPENDTSSSGTQTEAGSQEGTAESHPSAEEPQ